MSAPALESGGPPSLAALCLARLARGAPQRVLLTILRCVCPATGDGVEGRLLTDRCGAGDSRRSWC